MMKKIHNILIAVALLAAAPACTKTGDVPAPAPGKGVGEIYVTSKGGSRTVLVSLPGLWRVTSLDKWISVDVNGRNGEGAFTMTYGSNESDFVRTNPTRRGAVVITDIARAVADTVYLRQQGTPDGKEYSSTPQDSYIEFVDAALVRRAVMFASFKGCSDFDAFRQWVAKQKVDILALTWTGEMVGNLTGSGVADGIFTCDSAAVLTFGGLHAQEVARTAMPSSIAVNVDGINVHVADFSRQESAYTQMMQLLDAGYNCPGMSSKWIVGGTFYQFSVMETGYPDTPSWYPAHPSDPAFDSDRYAQDNLLKDCVWMTSRKFNPTFTEGGRSWRADYVYASNAVWNSVIAVEMGGEPLETTSHKTITLIVKY